MKRKKNHHWSRTKRKKIASKIPVLPEIPLFPSDVLILIFKLLTPSERLNATTVCHYWLDVVNQYFNKDHCLVLSSDLDYSTTGSLYQTFSNRLASTKRTFSQMVIESFPKSTGKLSAMGNFIELVKDEVKSLKIEKISFYPDTVIGTSFKLNLFSKLSKLETLEVSSDLLLADLSCSTSLKSIKVLSSSCDLKHVENYRKVKSLESLTMKGIKILRNELNDELLVSILEPSTKKFIEPYNDITLEAPTFNFCGKAKMTPDDINGIQMTNYGMPLSQEILSGFGNLKRLKFCLSNISFGSPLVQLEEPVTYSGITKLTVKGFERKPSPHFYQLFQSFPDLEYLKLSCIAFNNEQFSIICQNCSKLKKLVLRGPFLPISILDRQSLLKDLHFLEELEIEKVGNFENRFQDRNDIWPPLPNLKELNLQGNGFDNYDRDFYSQIAQNSPKLTHITIGNIAYQLSTFTKFLPLVQQLKLTNLTIPSVNDAFDVELTANLIKYCQDLKEVTISGSEGSLSQEVELFTNIASLTKITGIPTWMENTEYLGDPKRVMKRKDVKDLKGYLVKNLAFYKNLRETVDYVAESVIPPNEFQEMNQSYQTNYANDDEGVDDLANFYVVTQNYLQMSNFNLCKLLYIRDAFED